MTHSFENIDNLLTYIPRKEEKRKKKKDIINSQILNQPNPPNVLKRGN